jgi:hypothetical protein
LINHPVEITLFGDNPANTYGIVTLIRKHPEHEEKIELSPAQVNGEMAMSHYINVAMIQGTHPLEKPKYSTEELANLMMEKGIGMEKSPMKNTTRSTSPQSRGHSRTHYRMTSRAG